MVKCPHCNADLTDLFRELAAKGGRAGKGKKVDREKMRQAALARWRKKP